MKQKRYSGVLIKYKDKFLLCKRNLEDSYPGIWSIPGGQIEGDEESSEAALREFFEETSININDYKLNFVGIVPRNSESKKISGYMYVYYIDTKNKITPNLNLAVDGYEHTECGYFTKDELNSMETDNEILKLINSLF
jgi:ADP-ribose pyrophosphatase YjhB (NUDIX family)